MYWKILNTDSRGASRAGWLDILGPALRKTLQADITRMMETRLEPTLEPGPEPRETASLCHRRRQAAFAVTGLLFAATLANLPARPRDFGDRAGVDRPRLARLEQGVDPDSAAWFELAQLPGIGETIAKRIVTFRATGWTGGERDGRVFTCPADLTNVRGVGGRTIHRIGPYLRFPSSPP